MGGDLSAIRMRVNKLKADCITPASNFYQSPEFQVAEIGRIDRAIQGIKDRLMSESPEGFALEEQWKNFKEHLLLFVETDKKVRAAEGESETKTIDLFFEEVEPSKGLSSIKAVWARVKGEHPHLKDLVAAVVEPLENEIASMLAAERPTPPPVAQRAQTPEEIAIAESQITLEQERVARAAKERRLIFQNKPNIAKLVRFLALRLTAGEYGEKIKDAFFESHPSVIGGAPLLKFLLIEASNHSSIPHALNQWELDLSEENWAMLDRSKDQIENVSSEVLEEVFFEEGPLSQKARELSAQLNEAVKDIRITREDEQMCGKLLCDILEASSAYQEALMQVDQQAAPLDQIQLLEKVVLKYKSLDPQAFFAAIDRALQAVNMEDEELKDPQEEIGLWLTYLSEELKSNPSIMTSFREGDYLSDHLERTVLDDEDARFSVLLIPELLRSNPSLAFKRIKDVLKCAREHPSLIFPVELFQMFLECDPVFALQIAEYVPIRERFQCIIRVMHLEVLGQDELVDQCIEYSRDFFEESLFDYLCEPTPQNTQKVKTEIRRLLKYLTAEIGESLPQAIKESHPNGSAEEQIEYALVEHCLDIPGGTPEEEFPARDRIRTLFFPELVRIGKKEDALKFAREDLAWINDRENLNSNPPIKELVRSLLKASGFKWEVLDASTFGALSEPPQVQILLLDPDFISLYFEAMGSARDPVWAIAELIVSSSSAHQLAARFNNPSYEAFSSQAASLALEMIKGTKKLKRQPIQTKIASALESINLVDLWIRDLGFLDPQPARVLRRESEVELFDLRVQSLAAIQNPVYQINCRIALFEQSVFLEREAEGLVFAREALRLKPAFFLDQGSGLMKGPFIDLLNIAIRNVEMVHAREGEEARQVESEMKTFILDLVGSLDDFDLRIATFILVARRLSLPSLEFSLEAARRAFEEIRTFRERRDINQLVGKKMQKDTLIQLIWGFEGNAPAVIASAKILLAEVLQELFNLRSVYIAPIEKLEFLTGLIKGFEVIENSDRVISLTREAYPLINPRNFQRQEVVLSKLVKGLIVYIKRIHDARGGDLSLAPDPIEVTLIELVVSGILSIPVPDKRIMFFLSIPSDLKKDAYLEDSTLYKEFSRRALKLALEEVKALEIVGPDAKKNQEELIGVLIRSSTPIDPALAEQFENELRQMQESHRLDLKRKREEEGPGDSSSKKPNV